MRKASKSPNKVDASATALVSMRRAEKERLVAVAREHGLSLSAFLRLAADEYIRSHGWELEQLRLHETPVSHSPDDLACAAAPED